MSYALTEILERLDDDQKAHLDRRINILFHHNPIRKHPILQYLVEKKKIEIGLKLLGS